MKINKWSKISVCVLTSLTLLGTVNAYKLTNQNIVFAKNYPIKTEIKNPAHNWETKDNLPLMQSITANHEITYQITTNNSLYQAAYQNAVNAWNQLNVIKLVASTNNPQITLNDNHNHIVDYDADGATDYQTNNTVQTKNSYQYKTFNQAQVAINVNINHKNYARLLQYTTYVAEHEIGHALGFDHDNTRLKTNKIHIMNDNYTYKQFKQVMPLNNYEKQTLLMHYQYQF